MMVSALSLYPVKSMAGLDLPAVQLDRFGFAGDRRWMVVDENRRFLSQRELPAMALITATPTDVGLRLASGDSAVLVSRPDAAVRGLPVQVWEDRVMAQDTGSEVADWLGEILGVRCQLVYMADDAYRYVDGIYARGGETVSFADGFPLLLISHASLEDLNSRLSAAVPMNRFRPNLVVQGSAAFAEDRWRRIRIGDTEFEVAKACSRCVMPSIDQATARKDSEILRVLASYRRGEDRQTYFGQNLLYTGTGELRVGDNVEVLEAKD